MKLTPASVKLYRELEKRMNGSSEIRVSIDELVSVTSLSRATIYRARKGLIKGLILETLYDEENRPGRGKITTYKKGSQKPSSLLIGGLVSANGVTGNMEVCEMGNGKNEKRGSGGVARGGENETLSSGEWILLYEKACRLIGRPFMPRSLGAEKAKRSAASRIREGFSRAQLIEAVGYAAEIWEGDRWSQWKNLVYIWGSNLDTILSTKGEVGKRKISDARFTKGEERQEMKDEATRRVARQIEEQDRATTEQKRQPTLDQLEKGGSR